MILALFNKQIKAIGIVDDTVSVINNDIVEDMLVDSGYSGNNFETYILYNNENIPTYTLGVSENGYIIVENTTLAIHEYGEGNPYENADGNLFYAGPLNYYNKENNVITDLTTMEIVSDMAVSLSISREINNGDTSTMSVVESGVTKVSNYKNYLQSIAFGKNTNNVCGAVAVQIVLNYLELQTKNDFVHSSHNSESLSATTYSASRYPKAAAMLSHLVNVCGIGSNVSFFTLVNGVSRYSEVTNITDTSIGATYAISPSTTTIKNRIYGNSPVILLTQSDPDYGNHYLVAYGYKTNSQGNIMWMVHTGWYYNSDENIYYIIEDNDIYRHKDIFIEDTYVEYAIYFNY